MKKAIFAIAGLFCLFAFQQPQQQRYYQFAVPSNLATQLVYLVQGNANQVNAADARAVENYVVNQYLQQSRQYFVEDSTKAAQEGKKPKEKVKP